MKKLILALLVLGMMVGNALAAEPASQSVDVTLEIAKHGVMTVGASGIAFNLENGASTDSKEFQVDLAANYHGQLQVAFVPSGAVTGVTTSLTGTSVDGTFANGAGNSWTVKADLDIGEWTSLDADAYNNTSIGTITVTVLAANP